MFRAFITILCAAFFTTCTSSQYDELDLSKNELYLLGSYDDLTTLDEDISELRDTVQIPLDSLFQVDGYSVRYKVNHPVGNQVISLKMASSDLTK